MPDKTIEMLKTHAMYLLGIEMKVYKISELDQILKYLKTPFMNSESKQLKKRLKEYINEMSSSHIYEYINEFKVHYYIFKYSKRKQLIIIGPYLIERPSDQKCHEMLQGLEIAMSKLPVLKRYLLNIPVSNNRTSLKMTHLAVRFIKDRNINYKVTPFSLKMHTEEIGYSKSKEQNDFTLKELEERYKIQNQLLIAIENGDIKKALDTYNKLSSVISGMQRATDFMTNEKYKAYILNTLSRIAIERAGVNLIMIDQISAKNANRIDEAVDSKALHEVMETMIIEYTELALKVKQYAHTPKINKALQYIDIHLDQNITLQSLADNVGLSSSYLSRIFSDELKMTVSQYIIQQRVKVGRDLLMKTNMTIAEIATYVGFQKQSYFTQRFKEKYLLSPLKYKKQTKQKNVSD